MGVHRRRMWWSQGRGGFLPPSDHGAPPAAGFPLPGFSPELEVLMSVFPAIFQEETGSYLGNQFSLIGFCLKNVML